MAYIPPATRAKYQGRASRCADGTRRYPIKGRGLSDAALRLGDILQSRDVISPPFGFGRDPGAKLVAHDILGSLRPHIPNVAALYVHSFGHFIIGWHDLLIAGERKKFPDGFWKGWQGKTNFLILTDYLFNARLGVTMDGANKAMDPRILRGEHAVFLAAFGLSAWEDVFEVHKLSGGLNNVYGFSAARAIQDTFHWAFDLGSPEGRHAHPWDFVTSRSRNALGALQTKKRAVLHILEKHLGLQLDPVGRTFDPRLLPNNQEDFLAGHGCATWTELSRKFGFSKFARWGEDHPDKIFRLIKEVLPWIFDLSTPEGRHLHYPDFKEAGMFEGEEGRDMAITHIKHLLEAHHGLKMDQVTGRIDPGLFTPKGQKAFLTTGGFTHWQAFVRKYALEKILPQVLDFQITLPDGQIVGSFIKALRIIYPWAFDLSRPKGEHLHFWEFGSPYKWMDLADSRIAFEHELANSDMDLASAPLECTFAWFRDNHLRGLVFAYNGSPLQVFQALYPEHFASGLFQAGDFNPNPFIG